MSELTPEQEVNAAIRKEAQDKRYHQRHEVLAAFADHVLEHLRAHEDIEEVLGDEQSIDKLIMPFLAGYKQ